MEEALQIWTEVLLRGFLAAAAVEVGRSWGRLNLRLPGFLREDLEQRVGQTYPHLQEAAAHGTLGGLGTHPVGVMGEEIRVLAVSKEGPPDELVVWAEVEEGHLVGQTCCYLYFED
jgi:hypothetical protein